jgi:hypothetical protein
VLDGNLEFSDFLLVLGANESLVTHLRLARKKNRKKRLKVNIYGWAHIALFRFVRF